MRAVLLAIVLLLAQAFAAAATVEVAQARVFTGSEAEAALLPADLKGSSQAIALPDNWLRTRPEFAGAVWYVVDLDAALAPFGPTPSGLVVLVRRAADKSEFWLNGERLDTGSEFSRYRTLWLELPRHVLRPQGNVLHVRLQGVPDVRAGLSLLELGPRGELRMPYEVRRFFQTTVPQVLTFAVLVCFVAAVPLWLKTRRRTDLLFAALTLSWMPRALLVLSSSAGAPGPAGWLIALASTLVSATLMVMLILELMAWKSAFWQRYEKLLWTVAALSFAVGVVLSFRGLLRPAEYGMLLWGTFGLFLVPALQQARLAWRARRRRDIVLAAVFATWYVACLHDLAIAADVTAFHAIFWAPTPALAVLLSLIWMGVEGLALMRGNADHEIRVHREEVIARERSRLLHDLHDGLGSQLITALRMTRRDQVPREDVARVIEDSLEDMRLIIDSLDVEERDLLPLLGNLRYRLDPRLNAIGVALHWQVEALPELNYLSPETGLAIVRIVQEAVNNAVRHGNARNITVRTHAAEFAIELSVRDDGHGFDPSQPPRNGAQRGLGAMRSRAGKLGGSLAVDSGAAGTTVRLTLPLQR